jgi:hypothetical protein
MQYPMLIMSLLVLSIGFLQNLMDMLSELLNSLNEYGGFVGFRMNMGRFFLCGGKRYCNINGTQGLESQPHLKCDVVGGVMESPVVVVLNIGETFILVR